MLFASIFGRFLGVLRWLLRNWRGVLIAVAFWHIGWYMGWFIGRYRQDLPPAKTKPTANTKANTPAKKHKPSQAHHTPAPDLSPRRPARRRRTAAPLVELQTTRVTRAPFSLRFRLIGSVRRIPTLSKEWRFPFEGKLQSTCLKHNSPVHAGLRFCTVESEQRARAQRDFLRRLKTTPNSQPSNRSASPLPWTSKEAQTLLRFGFSKAALRELVNTQKPQTEIALYAPFQGRIIRLHQTSTSFSANTAIYRIEDRSKVWLDVPLDKRAVAWLKEGQRGLFESPMRPGIQWRGTLAQLQISSTSSNTWRARFVLETPKELLRPSMVLAGELRLPLDETGAVQTRRQEPASCPFHPTFKGPGGSRCAYCGTPLQSANPTKNARPPLTIPHTAPLRLEGRAIVYVQSKQPTGWRVEPRSVILGPKEGDRLVVLQGLKENEWVVTHGAFQLDSELYLTHRGGVLAPLSGSLSGKIRRPRPLPSELGALHTPENFLLRLRPVYKHYLELQKALFEERPKEIRKAILALKIAFEQKRAGTLPPSWRNEWKKLVIGLHKQLHMAQKSKTMEQLRERFLKISRDFLRMVYIYGHTMPRPLYEFHCSPKKGTALWVWLQARDQTVQNPYNPKLLGCGVSGVQLLPRPTGKDGLQ